MIDCIDEQITKALINNLQQITKENGYKYDIGVNVQRLRSNMKDLLPPFTLVLENQPDIEDESSLRNDTLNFVLYFEDGISDEDPDSKPITERLANCHADITKCLLYDNDPQLEGLCEWIQIRDWVVDWSDIGCGFHCYISVKRMVNTFNPYLQF